jgi:NAD(P)-dependent dehydrogenase (short-subunit alcohol dehydrogenase family)
VTSWRRSGWPPDLGTPAPFRYCPATLTRYEDRYAQAIGSGGQAPTGDLSRDEEIAKKLLTAKSPLGVPWIDPADVAPVVAFLASDEARMVSGASFAVTAGDSANITA